MFVPKFAHVIGVTSAGMVFSQLTSFNKVDFDYDKHGLSKGDYLLTVNTFEDPKKLGLVLIKDAKDNKQSFKIIKNVPGQYVLNGSNEYFQRVPRGMLYVRDPKDQNDSEYIFISSVVGSRHFRLPDFKSIK